MVLLAHGGVAVWEPYAQSGSIGSPATCDRAHEPAAKPGGCYDHRVGFNWKSFFALLAGAVVIVLLWDTWAIYPLKILVVFFHELSHGLMAILTGGEIDHIELVAQQGGKCFTRGGSRFFVASAGYVGSMVFGGVILALAARTKWDRAFSIALGVILLGVAVVWVRPLVSFGFGFCALSGLVMLGMGWKLPQAVNDAALKLIGLVSCLYPIPDIKSDVLDRDVHSDASTIAELTHIPKEVWGVAWIVVALIVGLGFLWLASRGEPEASEARPGSSA
jgi:hypothetical protein